MISNTENAEETVDDLLRRGLELYGRNEVEEAVQCWRQVLAHSPTDQQAKDYLECAGAAVPLGAEVIDIGKRMTPSSHPPPKSSGLPTAHSASAPKHAHAPDSEEDVPPASQRLRRGDSVRPPAKLVRSSLERVTPPPSTRHFVQNLLTNGRLEEALSMLYQARADNPMDSKLSKSIRLMRERLILHYTAELENLDLVPVVNKPSTISADGSTKVKLPTKVSEEDRQVLRLVDGISTYDDIVSTSSLGRLSTLRILCKFHQAGVLSHSQQTALEFLEQKAPSRPSSRPEDPYAKLFAEATTAYLVRDLKRAEELFCQCQKERPEDRRVTHNLNALRRKLTQ